MVEERGREGEEMARAGAVAVFVVAWKRCGDCEDGVAGAGGCARWGTGWCACVLVLVLGVACGGFGNEREMRSNLAAVVVVVVVVVVVGGGGGGGGGGGSRWGAVECTASAREACAC